MTLNQIVDHVKRFASVHKNLKGNFFEGYLEDFCNEKDQAYPVLIMTIKPTGLSQGNKAFTGQFSVWDKVELDGSNRLEVQSDTEQICSDLVAYMNNADDLMEVQLPVNIEHSQEKFPDDVAGSEFDMVINTFFSVDVCETPLFDALQTEYGEDIETEDGELLITE